MSDLLSDDQINALFEAAKHGHDGDGFHKDDKKRHQSVREIDFSRPTKFSREQQRRIERAHEGFCRNAGNGFTAELRTTVEFDVLNAAQLSWTKATAEIPTASTYGIVTVQPLGTRALIAVETTAVMRVLERMLGGGVLGSPTTRQLTDIDLSLTRRFFS